MEERKKDVLILAIETSCKSGETDRTAIEK